MLDFQKGHSRFPCGNPANAGLGACHRCGHYARFESNGKKIIIAVIATAT
jgi:hypothetical protein